MEAFKDPLVFTAACALIGLFVGSFLNVVIHRLPLMMEREWQAEAAALRGEEPGPQAQRFNLATPGSRCPHCGHPIGALENLPILSYLLQRGRCRHCSGPISVRYPLIELLCAALSGFTAWHFGFGMAGAAALLFLWALIALCFIDLDTQLLPDSITLPLLWAGLLLNLSGTFTDISSAVVGAAAGYLTLWSVFWLFKLTTGKEGMGFGDFKLLAALGAWLGLKMILPVVLAASVIGAIVGIGMKFGGRLREGRYVPFGPFLAGAGLVVMLAGPARVLRWLGWA